MRAYWLSTPRWTCWIQVDAHGIIHDTAPLLRRRWRGSAWVALLQQVDQTYGEAAVRVEALPAAQGEMF